jgi:hypothetical protein
MEQARFHDPEQIDRVWSPPSAQDESSVYGEIAQQLREARIYYEEHR